MDVRCERCRTQYEFAEDQVGPTGLTVRCSRCGHVFMVKREALVVTVPVRPDQLEDAPVPTSQVEQGHERGQGTPSKQPAAVSTVPFAAAPAAGKRGEGARAQGAWSLRTRYGTYAFKDLATLQKWIVERKAIRADEISRDGGAWRRLGDMPELEPFFGLVEQAERAAAGTLAATPRSDSPARPAPAGDDGPILPERMASISAPEPAWTADGGERPIARETTRRAPVTPKGGKKGWRLAPLALLLLLVLGGAAAAVYLTHPEWLRLGLEALKRPTQVAQAPQAPDGGAQGPQVPDKAAEAAVPDKAGESAQPASTAPSEPSRKAVKAVPDTTGESARSPPPPGATATVPDTAAPAAPAKAVPDTATAGESAQPLSTAPAKTSPSPLPAPGRDEHGQESPGGAREAGPTASAAPPPRPGNPVPDTNGVPDTGKAGKAVPDTAAPGAVASAPPRERRPAKVAEPRKPPTLKSLLADARRLRERGRADAALDVYGQALQLDGKNADALAGRGLCYLDLSRYEPAKASFEAALEADAQHAGALMGLAETYRYEGRRAEAVTYYRKYLADHPDGRDAVAARNAIDALKE